jgi:hypothetical protein
MPGTVPPLTPLEAKHDECHTPKFPGLGLIHSLSTHLDPTSTNRRSTKEQGLHATRPGVFSPSHHLRHHGVQGWPAIPGARRYSSFHSARQNFTSKAPPASLPSLDPIKGKAGDSTKGGQGKKQVITPPQKINISSNFLCTLFETWDRLPLSQLVTPTQALRCKEIQYFPPAGRRAFFRPNQDKLSVYSLCITIQIRDTQHKFTRWLRTLTDPNTDRHHHCCCLSQLWRHNQSYSTTVEGWLHSHSHAS